MTDKNGGNKRLLQDLEARSSFVVYTFTQLNYFSTSPGCRFRIISIAPRQKRSRWPRCEWKSLSVGWI